MARRRLNTYLDLSLLRRLGLPVQQVTPYTVICPFCKRRTLDVFREEWGSPWLRCRTDACNFSGGALDLATAIYGTTPQAAVERLLEECQDTGLQSCVDPTLVGLHIEDVARRAALDHWWHQSSMHCKLTPSDLLILRNMNLWPGHEDRDRLQRLFQFAIPTSRRSTEDSLGLCPDKNISKYRRLLAVRWEDVPGRVQALEFRTEQQRCWQVSLDDEQPSGLFCLSALPPGQSHIFALSDSWLALRLQYTHLHQNRMPLPVVAWHDNSAAWPHLGCNQVVFWEQTPTPEMFRMARRVPGAVIALWTSRDPHMDRCVTDGMVWLLMLKRRALDWPQALRSCLMDLPPSDIGLFLRRLAPSEEEWGLLLDACEPSERQRFEPYMVDSGRREIGLGSKSVIQRAMRWYRLGPGGSETLLSDAPFEIRTITHSPHTGRIVYSGVVHYQGQTVPFEIEESAFRHDPTDFLRRLLIRNGLGYPIYQSGALTRGQWIDTAVLFRRPTVVVRTGRVGWDAKLRAFVYPRATIDRQGIQETDGAISPEAVPCAHLVPQELSRQSVEPYAVQSDSLALCLACLACVSWNLTAQFMGRMTRPIGLIGRRNESVARAWSSVVRGLGLIEISLSSDRQSYKDLLHWEAAHDPPVAMTLVDDRLTQYEKWLRLDRPKNAMILVSRLMAYLSCMEDGAWSFIRCPQSDRSEQVPGPEVIGAWAGSWLTRLPYLDTELDQTNETAESHLNAICTWLGQHVVDAERSITWAWLRNRASQMLAWGTPHGPLSATDRLFSMLFYLLDQHWISIGPTNQHVIHEDERHGLVHVRLDALGRTLKRHGYNTCISSEMLTAVSANTRTTPEDEGEWSISFEHGIWASRRSWWCADTYLYKAAESPLGLIRAEA